MDATKRTAASHAGASLREGKATRGASGRDILSRAAGDSTIVLCATTATLETQMEHGIAAAGTTTGVQISFEHNFDLDHLGVGRLCLHGLQRLLPKVLAGAWTSGQRLYYAVLYSYTSGVFPYEIRGTACGVAEAMSRLAGIVSPLIVGAMMEVNTSFSLCASAPTFLISGICMVSFPIEDRGRASE
ncbi:hypothetical protein EMPS_07278 [Entomortierella parvispora]|uniref:Major facilitator superfamily (MFS) profile domain-containing protein n=1 Tax=Entomortierella parvispora TaxID=205924 RepID=A0A9P3LYJ1_9FUNG|nr:hypothetical protein EMPS_07278 [Entomortierella parvispora]